MMVEVIDVKEAVVISGGVPDKVILTVLFSVEHSVKTLALTWNFWWVAEVSNPKMIVLEAKIFRSI